MMKNYLLFTSILAFLISCSGCELENERGSPSKKINFEIDTVLIDAGDHFFFVQYGLSMSGLDRENKQFLNYNPDKFEVEVIDLTNRKLHEVKAYEKEGPNGIGGGFIIKIQRLPNQDMIFYDYNGLHFLDPSGQKIKTLLLEQTKFSGDSLKGDEVVEIRSLVTKDGKVFYGFYGIQSFDGKTKGLAIVDIEKNSLKLIPSDVLDFTAALAIDYDVGGGSGSKFPEQNHVYFEDNKMIISSSAKNQVWIYDLETDSLATKTFESKLTSNSKKGAYPRKVSSTKEWTDALKEKRKEVSFNKLIYQEDEGRFWRFSTEMDRLTAGDSVVMKTVLTAFDKDLNQLAEKQLPENFQSSGTIFELDGMLWQFLNRDDEVAFVRIKPTLSDD